MAEALGGKEIAVICDRHGGHPAAGCFTYKFGDVACAIEQTIVGVQVQMDKRGSFHARSF
jgi:hypothetical protein